MELLKELPETYFSYMEDIERMLTTGFSPEDNDEQEFGEFSSSVLNNHSWNPNRYSKAVIKVLDALSRERTTKLGEIATIIRPRPDVDKKHTTYVAFPMDWQYPVDYSKLREGVLTDTPLQKGDIVFMNANRMFLVNEPLEHEVHTSPNFTIIRPKEICSEYLFLYLRSETAQIILNAESTETLLRRVRRDDLMNPQVTNPAINLQYYRNIFNIQYLANKDISSINDTLLKSKLCIPQDKETIEDILGLELLHNLRVYCQEIKEKILEEDMRELNICFRNKAYKATLILAGSILESVLIDWLSELKGVNYFNNEYIDHQGKQGTLATYIRDIKYLKRPGWMDEAQKAYKIKDMRNQVHAKLCLKSDIINEELCREVISYLADVLKTRNGKMRLREVKDR